MWGLQDVTVSRAATEQSQSRRFATNYIIL